MKSRWKQNNSGMSLIEVVIAMTVLALISLPLLKYFSDSMKYSAKMAVKQKATAESQFIVENMVNQTKLMQESSGSSNYTVSYLVDDLGFEEYLNTFDASCVGDGTYLLKDTDYDVVVKVSTDVDINSTAHPYIYGVDDTTDIFAVERSQENEALVHFLAGATSSYSSTMIKQLLTKEMHIEIGGSAGAYTVKIYYVFTCPGEVFGGGADQTYASVSLVESSLASLDNIFVLYNRTEKAGAVDTVKVSKEATVDVNPKIYMICQNIPDNDTPDNRNKNEHYTLSINRVDSRWTGVLCTNIRSAGGTTTGNVTDPGHTPQGLTDSTTSTRLVSLEVSVYEPGYVVNTGTHLEIDSSSGAELYNTITTTKGE